MYEVCMHYLKIIVAWCLGLMIWSTGCAFQMSDQPDFSDEDRALNVAPAPVRYPDPLPPAATVDPPTKPPLGDSGSVIDPSGRVDIAKPIELLLRMHMKTCAQSNGESTHPWD